MEERPISTHAVLADMIQHLSGLAYTHLGLHPEPISGKITKNLEEARVAIDAAAALADLVLPVLDAADRSQLQGLVRDLRLNYVNQSKDAPA